MAKKPAELKPEIDEIPPMPTIPENMNSMEPESEIQLNQGPDESNDSFFKTIINKLFDKTDISLKTEYLNTMENFAGSKLQFLAKYGNMPYLNEFIDIFETKRVSLKRKGRQEIIMALQQKEQEDVSEKAQQLKSIFGIK